MWMSGETHDALETLIPEFGESEDERIRKAALEGIEYLERKLGWDAIGDIDILDVKQYLEKQKEQKPAEWSEEDEEMRNLIIETLDDNSHYFPFKETKKKMRDWLKSLPLRCPKSSDNWKPSEEQMEALDKAIPVCMGVVGRDEITPLESLLQDLKKRM